MKEFEVFDLTGDTAARPKRSPLKLIQQSNLNNVVTTMQPLSVPEASLNVRINECPVCEKTFKSARGVISHRSSKNSKCKAGKSHKGSNKSNSTLGSGKGKGKSSTRNVLAPLSTSTPVVVGSIQNDSVIHHGPRVSGRRSLRAQEKLSIIPILSL